MTSIKCAKVSPRAKNGRFIPYKQMRVDTAVSRALVVWTKRRGKHPNPSLGAGRVWIAAPDGHFFPAVAGTVTPVGRFPSVPAKRFPQVKATRVVRFAAAFGARVF